MKTRLLIIIGIGTIGFSGTAFACMCDDLSIEQRINQADVIFSGTVQGNAWNHYEKNIVAGFDVQVTWKGSDTFPMIESGYVEVITPKVSTACGANFISGKKYLIYAKADGTSLATTTCDGSWFLDGRADDVKILDAMGATHHFIDARKMKNSSPDNCEGPGLVSFEQCEFDKLVRNVFLPIRIALPIVGISVLFIWRKRK